MNTELQIDGKAKKKITSGSVKLQVAGDLILARNPDRALSGLFKRYESLLEVFANMERGERILNYKFLIGLIITSHAKKTQSLDQRKKLFDLKNELYLNIANDRNLRKVLAFKYLVSKNFRVVKFCDSCTKSNTEANITRHDWKFCKDCQLDRKFYNVMSMHHKFSDGSVTLFLSNDLVHLVNGLKLTTKGDLDDYCEEARYDKYLYNVRNLDVFSLDSVIQVQKKLLELKT